MASSNIKSVDLLPTFLKTNKNSKFLSGTLDQLINPAQLERLNGYIGSTSTPNYNSVTDLYISETLDLRSDYQLSPALVVNDILNNVKDVQGFDDLINEISIKGGVTDNIDRLFRSDFYSYNPHIDLDKLINYQNYFWLSSGPELISIETDNLDVDSVIVGATTYTTEDGITLSNGMLITFGGLGIADKYHNKEFFVEGVGVKIVLVPFDKLITPELSLPNYIDNFDNTPFDNIGFDSVNYFSNTPEYITINRASQNLNPWSRYNRWVHKDVIDISAAANGLGYVDHPAKFRAQRPIIEFKADLQLFNFGLYGIKPVDLFDNKITNAFGTINGSILTTNENSIIYIDNAIAGHGDKVIFNADSDPNVRGKIFVVKFITLEDGITRLSLVPDTDQQPTNMSSVSVLYGDNRGSTWWYDGSKWNYSQQRTKLNQAPLFDLFDIHGNSYGDLTHYKSNFTGNKIFGYKIGTGSNDQYLGFPLSYKNINSISAWLFSNHIVSDTIVISLDNSTRTTISTKITYCKVGDLYENAWEKAVDYPIPLIKNLVNEYYQEPLGLTNNPLNGSISEFTISELGFHLQSMVNRIPNFTGYLRDQGDYLKYGTELISNANPIAFAQMFIGKKEHSVIDAITKTADQYNQFKFTFLNGLLSKYDYLDPVEALDLILLDINKNKHAGSSYHLSDMLGYGTDKIVRTWTVTSPTNKIYPLRAEFNLDTLSLRSVLIYLNGSQLTHGYDYKFRPELESFEILIELKTNDVIKVNDYTNTEGIYIPPTPTKLGLYPKFQPKIYVDNTYTTPTTVIQGHDGSIMIAYNDYKDDIILELEKRIYNNIKASYRSELFDVNTAIPGAFRTTNYTTAEVNNILQNDLSRWAGQYGIDYTVNDFFDISQPLTWNYVKAYNTLTNTIVSGSTRAVHKYFYDTDRPNTHPWEMLGFSERPDWWISTYGDVPYTSSNLSLWHDLRDGYIRGGNNPGVNSSYVRPQLMSMLPVDSAGNLLDPTVNLLTNTTPYNARQAWVAGDQGPYETAWRRSSYWPFAVQKLLALTIPSTYASLMYDPSRIQKNIAGQWTYGLNDTFLRLPDLYIHGEDNVLTNGYGAMVSEIGQQRTQKYISELRQDLNYVSYNLFHKVGGFVNKNTLQILIDAYEPTTNNPSTLLPQENYKLRLNVSNPVKSIGISGFIIQKANGNYTIKGYDRDRPYFTYYKSIRNSTTPAITIGGVSEPYVTWASDVGTNGSTGLTDVDVTTANSAVVGHFYQKGQLVYYGNSFYRVQTSHRSGSTFNTSYFQILSQVPTTGGATVQISNRYESTENILPYGTTLTTIQEVYDLIMGYGRWLEDQGFIFDQHSKELGTVIDWKLTAREFLFWTTQNWADNSIITLSPFADQIKYQFNQSIVDNIFNSFYEYSLRTADGSPYPQKSLSITRDEGICTIGTLPNSEGIYFARLNSVQKEHAMIFDNKTIFGDVIYEPETGNRQRRMKLVGFRTAGWNGDYFSPGFVYDSATITDWEKYTKYNIGDVVRFNGNYYSAINNIDSTQSFDFTKWNLLGKKPVAGLLPNFDYKISQFEDFYSLDIDNFDSGQQKMAQHLIGYTPRSYLNGLFTDPISQYKFYQGFIREKGTKNALSKLGRISIENAQGEVKFNEEWAFRVGQFGSFSSYKELETKLIEGTFLENPQIIKFIDSESSNIPNNLIHYSLSSDLLITPDNYISSQTFLSTSSQDVFLLTHSGFVRIDDVTATAYNLNSLLDIAKNSELINGDTIWLGFTTDGGWDIYRYTYIQSGIIGVYVSSPLSEITFTTDSAHGLSAGDIISISAFNDQVNGIYTVSYVPNTTQFVVSSTLASIVDAPLLAPGQLYKFKSAKINLLDSLPSDKELHNLPVGTKFWINSSPTDENEWAVYEKIKNYGYDHYRAFADQYALTQVSEFGQSLSKRTGNSILVTGAPNSYKNRLYGEITVLNGDNGTTLVKYPFNETYYDRRTDFGATVVYDDIVFNTSTYGLIFAGAPGAYNSSGTVKISSINPATLEEGKYKYITNTVRTYNAPSNDILYGERFGSSIFVQRNTSTKLVLIGAPGTGIVNILATIGSVYSYTVRDDGNNIQVSTASPHPNVWTSLKPGDQWGYSISGTDDASYIAISAPNYSTSSGIVSVFTSTSLVHRQEIKSPFGYYSRFGESIAFSQNGEYLFVSAPYAVNSDDSRGKVAIYKNENGMFNTDNYQILENPIPVISGESMHFGKEIEINATGNTLVIASQGTNESFETTFDNRAEIFDSGITTFTGSRTNSGAVYVYYKEHDRFILAEELLSQTVSQSSSTNFGQSIVIDEDDIFVGSPGLRDYGSNGYIFQFRKTDITKNSWNKIRSRSDLVITNAIEKISLIDTMSEDVLDYLEVIDPLKARIAGIAEQELSYKLISDPAVYSVGIPRTINDVNSNWLDDYVGKLWWDLSTAKYIWYEQSDLEYRKNNWGRLFPGATIDVYEWVSSSLLPSEWSSQADTTSGLANGISGQPKYADNTVLSVKQVYDPITNSFSNVYYYWVKNKITVPKLPNRKISSYEVASIIADPLAYGLKFAAVISPDSIALANVGTIPVDDTISLNIVQDISDENLNIPRHTEWLILQENSDKSMPNALLEKKLIDSLLGHDSLGNLVPSPTLTSRNRYGIGIRPQQTLFKNRLAALRNIVEFVNSVLIDKQITGKYNFSNLKAQEYPPVPESGAYDLSVLTNEELYALDTSKYQKAVVKLIVNNSGGIAGTSIISPGSGYGTLNPITKNTGTFFGPVLVLPNTSGSGATFSTVVDSQGRITRVSVLESGSGYFEDITVYTRPHTVIVESDSVYNGKWTQYEFDQTSSLWTRARTQKYNTELYWKYVDWISPDYNQYQDFAITVNDLSGIYSIDLSEGEYIKINNQGDGRYAILKKIANNAPGTYGLGFDIVYNQNGTIQILDNIWNLKTYGFDYENTWDQTLWDQTSDLELQYLIKALKNDIFINDLKINWNLLFFKSVKYAMTEQKSLDWVFKTSFINVLNNVGILDQRPLYKLQDATYYEQYINEMKPYRTQVRNFVNEYSVDDNFVNYTTDFDLPAFYDRKLEKFISVGLTDSVINQYPWKSWKDNYLLENNPVRKNITKLKFDRISKNFEIGNIDVNDVFIANGYTAEFELSWCAQPDKKTFQLLIDGWIVVSSDFSLNFYNKSVNGYNKKYNLVTFLNFIPLAGQIIRVSYKKSNELLNATERVLTSYLPTPGMPGVDLGQLMTGIDYPGITLGGQYEGNAYVGTGNIEVQGSTIVDTPGVILWPNSSSIYEPDTILNSLPRGTLASFDTTTISGIDPNELTLDGEHGFVTPNTSYAPEEVVPGQVLDSLGINVYTKSSAGAPLVLNRNITVNVSADNQSFPLMELPMSIDNISVVYLGKILEYEESTTSAINFTTSTNFSINWETGQLVIPPQTTGGILGYSIVGVGGGSGLSSSAIDKSSITVTNLGSATVRSLASYNSVKSAFVTVNGREINRVTTSTEYGYMLIPADSNISAGGNNRAAVKVYNLPTNVNTIQAWFFSEEQKYFNTVHEQIFNIVSTSTNIPLSLMYPPGNIEPVSSQAIVELTDSNGTRRLLPPEVTYFSVTDVYNAEYPVVITGINSIISDAEAQARISDRVLTVYQNGAALRSGFDYIINQVSKTVVINTVSTRLKVGDAIAIEACVPTILGTSDSIDNGVFYNYNYRIVGSNLYLAPGVQTTGLNTPGDKTVTNATIKVITYTNNDGSLMNTERFTGTPNRRFRISRPVLNDDYVWVTIYRKTSAGATPITYGLINKIDYILLSDNVTVQINDSWSLGTSDVIEIISISSQQLSSTVLGYRIFNDMLGNTTFTRLSAKNTTYLTRALSFTDTEIHVADSGLLTPPITSKNLPGVILVDGERIEFLEQTGNVLTKLRRATLGTGPSYYSEPGTRVLDQGVEQMLLFKENVYKQIHFTTSTTNTYVISKTPYVYNTGTYDQINSDGIVLINKTLTAPYDPLTRQQLTTPITLVDQVDVFYGGRKLMKKEFYYQDKNVSYDSISLSSIVGTVTSTLYLSTLSNVGDSYKISNLNQVWTYTGSRTQTTSTNGYVFSGIRYSDPEFTINTLTQSLILNTATVKLDKKIEILIMKKDFPVTSLWNTIDPTNSNMTLSLLDSNSEIAGFLRDSPAELPNSYYYGGDIELTDEGGDLLTDDNGNDLKGYY